MPPHPLTYFEVQKHYQNEPKFNGVYSRNNLPKIKDGAYIINLDEYKLIGTHWIALYVNSNNGSKSYDVTYFHSFRVEHSPKEIRKSIGNKNIMTNVYKMLLYDLIIWGYFCTGFIDFMLEGKSLLDYTNLFSPNEYEKDN